LFDNRIGEQLARNAVHIVGLRVAVDQENPRAADGAKILAEFGDLMTNALAERIGAGRANIDAGDHEAILRGNDKNATAEAPRTPRKTPRMHFLHSLLGAFLGVLGASAVAFSAYPI